MNVQEFIQQSLYQIAAAVESANQQFVLEKIEARANPRGATNHSAGGGFTYSTVSDTQMVDFDIALTATQSDGQTSGAGGGLKIYVASAGVESSNRSEATHSHVSRIKFKIPLKLPNLANEK
jgi:hypothetical protein